MTAQPPGGKRSQDQPLIFSFIIANYNYGRFVARAIESALAVDWPAKEVIVVDDGSTDDSRVVIDSFGERITAVYQANAGQRAANNAGFERASGDVIVFLDADDLVKPRFGEAIASVWRPGVSKVQVQMLRVDEHERSLGTLVPPLKWTPTPAQIRSWVTASTEYPTPPGSGNAYARTFLDRFFPIGAEHDSFTDSTCLALAPLLGDVVTIREPMVLYRIHGSNDSNLLAADDRFAREVSRAIRRQKSATAICGKLGVAAPEMGRLRRSRHLLQLRVASLRLMPHLHPMVGDSRVQALRDAFQSMFRNSFDPPLKRVLIAAWAVATLLAPASMARRLIRRRFRRT